MTQIQKPGRQPFDPADIEARRQDFRRLRRHLGVSAAIIAKITGLAVGTVKNYSATPSKPNVAPTWEAIVLMREEAIFRKSAEIAAIEESLFRAEVDLQQIMRTGIPNPSFVAGKSPADTSAAVTDYKGPVLPAPNPLQSPPATAVARQI